MIASQAVWRVARPTARPLSPEVHGLLEAEIEALPVRIKIFQNDVLTGWDDGALGFEEGAVWFNGRATSFRIVAQDILPGTYRLSRHEAVTDGEVLKQGLPLRHPERKIWIRVEVLASEEREEWKDEAHLIAEVKRLRELSPEEGESQYPPLSRRPGLPPVEPPPSLLVTRLQVGAAFAMLASFAARDFSVLLWGAFFFVRSSSGGRLPFAQTRKESRWRERLNLKPAT